VRRVSNKTLVGTAPEVIRHFIEIRGIGILDVKYLYGVGSVKMTENINLVISMELWNAQKNYERLGAEELTTDIWE
jgi:HPr kinase/phosphorylase